MLRSSLAEPDLRSIADRPLPWEALAGKTVLVTGANGFLAAGAVDFLLWLNGNRNAAAPTRVVGLVRNRDRGQARFGAHAGRADLELLVQDVCDPLPEAVRPDFVLHAASQASPKYYGVDPVGTLSANTVGTYRLLEHARRSGTARFLYYSSAEVYGVPPDEAVKEDSYGRLDPMEVRSCYAESKRMGENMAVSWHRQYGLSTVVVRPFHTYGPGMDLADGRVFADFVADVVAGRDIVLNSDGSAIRAFSFLSDTVAGVFAALLRGADATAYNIGNDRAAISVLGLAELLASLYPERGIRVRRQAPAPDASYLKSPVSAIRPDVSRLRALGWEPLVGLEEGFRKTIRSYE